MADLRWTLIFWALFLLLASIVANNNIVTVEPPRKVVTDAIRCYSCMSVMYESLFNHGLGSLFERPANFSDHCQNPYSMKGIATVECQSVCINMREEVDIMTQTFNGYIRGCYDRILKKGFNESIVSWFKWLQRDSCHFYNTKEVLKSNFHSPAKQNSIYICTCYSDGCNGSHGLNGANVNGNFALLLQKHVLILICLLSIWIMSSTRIT